MLRLTACLALVPTIFVITACTSTSSPKPDIPPSAPPPPGETDDVKDGVWPFWPQQMRIHPLTQFVTDRKTGEQLIEVRIEFFDQYGHTCKAVGQVVIELWPENAAPDAEPAGVWNRNLRNMATNYEHYDDVTGTYLFRLKVEDIDVPEHPEVRAWVWSGDGTHLQRRFVLKDRG